MTAQSTHERKQLNTNSGEQQMFGVYSKFPLSLTWRNSLHNHDLFCYLDDFIIK